MFYFVISFLTLCTPTFVHSVSIDIDGIIDFGPNWNYQYTVKHPHRYAGRQANVTAKRHRVSRTTATVAKVTLMTDRVEIDDTIYDSPHTVKDDRKINDFTFHVYKQSLKVFDAIRQRLDPNLSHKVDLISRSYDEKFREFVNETLNQKIKTRLGTQKVVLDTIDMSNRLLSRLGNYFVGEVQNDRYLRNIANVEHVLQNEINKVITLEYKHVCKKFGICRSGKSYSHFTSEILTILIQSNDKQLKQSSDALTEVCKNTDFSKIMDTSTKVGFKRFIEDMETWDAFLTRAFFSVINNIIINKNRPLKVMVDVNVDDTVMLLEVLDEFDKTILPNEENMLEWTDLKNVFTAWMKGKRNDITEIMQSWVSHVMKKGVDKMNDKQKSLMKAKLAKIFSKAYFWRVGR